MMTKSVLLPLQPAAAFELFTTAISDWWPASSRHTNDPASVVLLSAEAGLVERASDGHEIVLGKVLAWEPPGRILLDFFIATGPEQPTAVEIRFQLEGGGTRLTVVHRPKPESEALWDGRVARYERAWERVLAALAQAASGAKR